MTEVEERHKKQLSVMRGWLDGRGYYVAMDALEVGRQLEQGTRKDGLLLEPLWCNVEVMQNNTTKTCKTCGKDKPLSEMTPRKKNGKTYYTNRCKSCEVERTRRWQRENPKKYRESQDREKAARRAGRASGSSRGRNIYYESRKRDKQTGRDNDLTRDFVDAEIDKGCSYCGEPDIRLMTLDRIDNDRGHMQDNVVPACTRCNFTRKNMPYEAWLIVAKGMWEARLAGLFGSWVGGFRRSRGA